MTDTALRCIGRRWLFVCQASMGNGTLSKIGKAASDLIKGTFRLTNPSSVESQLDRGDMLTPDSEPAIGDTAELISLGNKRYEDSREGRYEHHGQFYEGLAFYAGKQDGQWDFKSQKMVKRESVNPDLYEKFDRRTENVIQTKADQMHARLCAAYPDAWAAPMTDSEEDKQAAQIGRAINAHCKRATKLTEKVRDLTLLMEISITCFLQHGWDNKASADVGLVQPDGTVKYEKAQIGDVEHNVLMAIDVYPDPNAAYNGGIHGGDFIITVQTRSLSYIKEKWGVTPSATCDGDTFGYLQQRLEWIAGDYSRNRSKIKNATEVFQMWEKPSPQYPKGRFVVWTSDKTLCHAGVWPYEKKDKYPFTAFTFKKNFGSVWGLNYVQPMLGIQTDLNDLATILSGRGMWDRPVIMNPSQSDIAPDDLTAHEYAQIINYKSLNTGGAQPTWMFPPPPGDFYFKQHDRLMAKLDLIAGVHEFNSDAAQTISSAKEYELRLEEDKARTRPVLDHIEENIAEIQEWQIALYRQYGTEFKRLLGLDDKANPARDLAGPGAQAAALVDLRALKNGQTRVVYVPGSGIAKLPAARQEEILELCKAMVNMPAPIVEYMLTQLQSVRSDQDVDRFLADYKVYEQQQASQAQQIQQMKGDQANQAMQAKTQLAQAQQAIEMQANEQQAAIKLHGVAAEQQLRTNADIAIEDKRHQYAMEQIHAKSATPTVSLKGNLGPVGVSSAEEAAGLEADDEATMTKLLTPVKPDPAKAGKPKRTT